MNSSARRCFRALSRYRVGCGQPHIVNSTAFSRQYVTGARQWSTPLAKKLAEAIDTTGPIPVATYMRQCLTSTDGGYYTTKQADSDQFGRQGDFITSPEISQVFGELVGIWIVAECLSQRHATGGIQLIELGPGRGTLMDDLLRTVRQFKPIADRIESIYMVEASPPLREKQQRLLCDSQDVKETEAGFEGISKHLPGAKIVWCDQLKDVPKDANRMPFIVAHEFFDALPIHVFKSIAPDEKASSIITTNNPHAPSLKKPNDWRELLVSPIANPSKLKMSPSGQSQTERDDFPEFQLSPANASTPHSMLLPETSLRYQRLKTMTGSVVEISPESLSLAAEIAMRIGGGPASSPTSKRSTHKAASTFHKTPSGGALILDYGPLSTIPANTLRGIRSHQLVSPFSKAGLTDLSIDVDFTAIAEAAINASEGVEVHGPVDQALWLETIGGRSRVDALVRGADEEKKSRIEGAWKRLVDRGPTGMGQLYKAMAVLPCLPGMEGRRPIGFGGDVVI
ncbi:DUF185-domain-containing protein [Eremomyces bilateralis CBS 781.70]|uniref:Protein arginine methyltransferase NDUFAF7 n=1 Tax=Eremomyces bilateralis CBS 781.70 TaxID=1392243 RepID=A0A6G1G4N9_9PEZI|nr:DUF185-domain-containing protein [Eremomyces bilateralis CBS 781.70]KAF1813055.1 DUF185-domain-containing protein [Eremomyces bilateralis CBS 781.70]